MVPPDASRVPHGRRAGLPLVLTLREGTVSDDRPYPSTLWAQALDEHMGHETEEMRARFRELMREHGHLVPRCDVECFGGRCDLPQSHDGPHMRRSPGCRVIR